MAEISKQALKVENNTEFPNNNNGAITPSNLRAFNVDMIDSTVNQTQYNADSASWNSSIDALEAFTSSQQPSFTALNAFTASQLNINSGVNSFTQSANGRLNNLEAYTASFTTSVGIYDEGTFVNNVNQIDFNGNGITASFVSGKASVTVDFSKLNSATASLQAQLATIGTQSGSWITESETGSFATSAITASSLITASFDNGTRNLTFTKGNNTTFAVNIPDVSGSSGNFVTTSSFNAYTASTDSSISQLNASSASQQISINALNTNSASVNISITNVNSATASLFTSVNNINTFTQSAQISINALNAATSSYATSAITASSLVTASFSGNTLTFTKGDNSTFGVVIPDVSGSTGNFATTGSNTFTGNQTVSGFVSASNGFRVGGSATALEIGDGSNIRFLTGSSNFYNIQLVPGVGDIAFSRDGGSNIKVFTLAGAAGNSTTFQNNPVEFQGSVSSVRFDAPIQIQSGINSNVDITGSLKISSTFDAPLTEGYVWVGANNGRTTTVATSSFGGTTDLTSLNSFTASQFVSNSYFATTGSNNFKGVQTINDVVGTGQGEVYLLARSGSLVLGNSTATPTYAALAHISSSQLNGNTNLIFKTNTNTADTIISGSANIFTNPAAPTAGFKRYMTGGNIAIGGNGVAIPQISGSMVWSPTIANNILASSANVITYRGAVSSSASTINNNVFAGAVVNLGTSAASNFERAASGLTLNANVLAGTLNALAFKTQLSASVAITSNVIGGTVNLNMDSSSIGFSGNSVQGAVTVNNSYFPAVTGSQLATGVNGGLYIGTHAIFLSGSNTTFTGAPGRTVTNAIMMGTNNVISASLNGDLAQVHSTALIGQGLIVLGTNSRLAGPSAADWGSAFVGRWNSIDGVRGQTAETVFAVGTGTGASTRKTGFLIDSGSNTFVEGTLNVSGSTRLSGSTFINNLQNGVTADVVTYDTTTGELRKASLAAITSASFDAAEFWSTTTQSGSAGVSGSITFNNSGSVAGISVVNNSQITVSQAGTYNVQFSAQLETSAGADTVYMWFKKNGNNISDSASKAVLANNTAQIMTVNILDEAVANDYYELAYQTLNGNATVLYEGASGNIPAIPSVILTVTQIR